MRKLERYKPGKTRWLVGKRVGTEGMPDMWTVIELTGKFNGGQWFGGWDFDSEEAAEKFAQEQRDKRDTFDRSFAAGLL